MGLPNGQRTQAYFKSCGKIAYGHQIQGIGMAVTKPWTQSNWKFATYHEKLVER